MSLCNGTPIDLKKSALGIFYVPGTNILDIRQVIDTINVCRPGQLSIVKKIDQHTGTVYECLPGFGDFDLRYAQALTYRPGDSTAGMLDDLEPLFELYRSLAELPAVREWIRETYLTNGYFERERKRKNQIPEQYDLLEDTDENILRMIDDENVTKEMVVKVYAKMFANNSFENITAVDKKILERWTMRGLKEMKAEVVRIVTTKTF